MCVVAIVFLVVCLLVFVSECLLVFVLVSVWLCV